MLSKLFRQRRNSQRRQPNYYDDDVSYNQPSVTGSHPRQSSHVPYRFAPADFTEADEDDDDEDGDDEDDNSFRPAISRAIRPKMYSRVTRHTDPFAHATTSPRLREEEDEEEDELPLHQTMPILPLFSSEHLDALPIYTITHAIRLVVKSRIETILSWDQLRSPQVSQFLIKPILQQIRTKHFSRATLYALLANCLQFAKEGQTFPANSGTSFTRAKVCELIAMKLLKEYQTRELIDALSYDFYPLQGINGRKSRTVNTFGDHASLSSPSRLPPNLVRAEMVSRTSTLEVAIRASAKHFLSHPVIIQHLEAIWNGVISFYSHADTLHRQPYYQNVSDLSRLRRSGTADQPDVRTPLLAHNSRSYTRVMPPQGSRRAVTLYDPRQSSLFKLSRLRVPRYRFFLSTMSLSILIGLFLAVLIQRSTKITLLELVFWFWSAGFLLDDLVGFTEQGFSLYIMSFWNLFDLGILLMLIVYYVLRAYSVFIVNPRYWNDMAYDVLAGSAVLLLPRIFSVLDHYQYFSQMIIAFRLMAVDVLAVFVIVVVACSGFFVFFTLSTNSHDASDVAYKIFQLLMGFTPAAWEVWPAYTYLGRTILVVFMLISHFVIVTILITVLTNSFMAIASNASQEHQFLFAINTISMVKDDSLFAYIPPMNILAWLLMPLRYALPLSKFVYVNRLVIKATHFPLLFSIYLYERYWLAPTMFEPTDLIDGQPDHGPVIAPDPANRSLAFNSKLRVRDESMLGFQKDQALEEVFRRPPDYDIIKTQRNQQRLKANSAIRTWMDQHDEENERLQGSPMETRRPSLSKTASQNPRPAVPSLTVSTRNPLPKRHGAIGKVEDEPRIGEEGADEVSNASPQLQKTRRFSTLRFTASDPEIHQDESVSAQATHAPHGWSRVEAAIQALGGGESPASAVDGDDELATVGGSVAETRDDLNDSASEAPLQINTTRTHRNPSMIAPHERTLSTNTIIKYNPKTAGDESSASISTNLANASDRRATIVKAKSMQRSPRAPASSLRRKHEAEKVKPKTMIARGRSSIYQLKKHSRKPLRRVSSADLSLFSDRFAPMVDVDEDAHAPYGSLHSQLGIPFIKAQMGTATSDDQDRMSRLVLAKMKSLEESLADIMSEVRSLRSASPHDAQSVGAAGSSAPIAATHLLQQPSTSPGRHPSRRTLARRARRNSSQPGIRQYDFARPG